MKKPHIPVRFVPIGATILVFLLAYAIGIANFRNFGSLRVFLNLLHDNAYLGVASIGAMVVILSGGIEYGTSLNDSPIHGTQVTLAYLGGHIGEVEVAVVQFVVINVLTEVRVRGVRCTEVDGLGVAQRSVTALARRGTREDTNLERTSGSMFGLCLLSNLCGCTLGSTGRCETTQTYRLTILY